MNGLWRHIAGGLDPTKLAAQLGMECDPWQRQVLRSNAPRVHINCARQTGKSTTVSIAALARAVYRPGSLVLIVSPTQRQSSELFRQVLVRYRQLGRPIESESENQLSLTLENGSRVISAPGSEAGIRTYSVDLLLVDEASRVDDEVFNSLSPMVAVTRGRIIATSTPMGRRGWWYEASLSRHWEHVLVPATECPRISPEFLEEERESLGDVAFRSEYLCEYVDAAGAAFDGSDIDAIFGPSPRRTAAPTDAEEPRPLTDAEKAHLEQQRMVGGFNRRRLHYRAEAKRRQKVCEHRWRTVPGSVTYCVWCDLKREVWAINESRDRRSPKFAVE